MFCPEGYVTFFDMNKAFEEFSLDLWELVGADRQAAEWNTHREEFLSSGADASSYFDPSPDTHTFFDAYRRWASSRLTFGQRARFVIASPSGTILRLGSYAFEANRVYFGPFPLTMAEQKALIGHLEDGCFHIVDYYGIIRPCADAEMIGAYGLETEVVSLSAFDGWAVCWKPKEYLSWKAELRAMLEDNSQPTIQVPRLDIHVKLGPPKKGGGVVEKAVQREFFRRLDLRKLPNDQREAAIAEAIAWAAHIFDEEISRSTMQRYLVPVFAKQDAHK
jgi:hypothetical protein